MVQAASNSRRVEICFTPIGQIFEKQPAALRTSLEFELIGDGSSESTHLEFGSLCSMVLDPLALHDGPERTQLKKIQGVAKRSVNCCAKIPPCFHMFLRSLRSGFHRCCHPGMLV